MATIDELYEALAEEDDIFANLDNALAEFDDLYVEGGADPTSEDDNCVGGACKL